MIRLRLIVDGVPETKPREYLEALRVLARATSSLEEIGFRATPAYSSGSVYIRAFNLETVDAPSEKSKIQIAREYMERIKTDG